MTSCIDCGKSIALPNGYYGEIADGVYCCVECLTVRAKKHDALKAKVRYWFDCEQAMFEGMATGGQTLAIGPFEEMQATQRELMEMVGWKPDGEVK